MRTNLPAATFTAYGRAIRRALLATFTRPRRVRVGDRVRTTGYPALADARVVPWPQRLPGFRMVVVTTLAGTDHVEPGWSGGYGLSAVEPVRALRLPWQR